VAGAIGWVKAPPPPAGHTPRVADADRLPDIKQPA
jgi:hypothetical protein